MYVQQIRPEDVVVNPLEPAKVPEPAESTARPVAGWRRFAWPILAVLTIAALAMSFQVGRTSGRGTPEALTKTQVASTIQAAIEKAAKAEAAAPAQSTLIYQLIAPSMVIVRTNSSDGTNSPGLGSGVIVNASGAILTSQHVIANSSTIEVDFADGTSTTAVVVEESLEQDTAILMPASLPEVLVPATLGGGVQVGDEIYAVGHPVGLVGSMSAGVVSGLQRSVPVEDGRVLEGLIQFDAAVNQGNSGGPLLNRAGQVVGVVTALADLTKTGAFAGISFAVPIGGAVGGGGTGSGEGPPR